MEKQNLSSIKSFTTCFLKVFFCQNGPITIFIDSSFFIWQKNYFFVQTFYKNRFLIIKCLNLKNNILYFN